MVSRTWPTGAVERVCNNSAGVATKKKRWRRHEEDQPGEKQLTVGTQHTEVGTEKPQADGGEPREHSLQGAALSRGP